MSISTHTQGPRNIRVNCLSPGPVNTLSARGIPGFTVRDRWRWGMLVISMTWLICVLLLPCWDRPQTQDMYKVAAEKAPLKRNAEIDEVDKYLNQSVGVSESA